MTAIRSLIFNLLFLLWSAFMHAAALPLLLAPRHWLWPAGRLWVGGVFALLRWIVGLDYEVRGRENLPDAPFLIASKHQSAWDTLVFPRIVHDPSYVLKRELLWIPLFGWYLRHYGVIAVDRRGGSAALRRMVKEARREAVRARPVVIYPEGTRTCPGESRPYHPGVAALYKELNLPVVPVALDSGLYWGRRAFRKLPGRIVVEILPPIPPGLSRRAFMERLYDELEGAAARLVVEARPPCDNDSANGDPSNSG